MNPRSSWHSAVLLTFVVVLCTPVSGRAQQPTRPKRLRAPATINGLIGGESTDRYLIRARKGQTLTVQISWKKEEDNTASFSVSYEARLDLSLKGQESDEGKRWTGKLPRTGNYLIEVVAHPYAHYSLRVRLK